MPFSISDCPINRRSHRPDQGVPRKTRARGRPDASHGGRYPKDLNPRQGITTETIEDSLPCGDVRISQRPQSPPGDYYTVETLVNACATVFPSQRPQSPPGDYYFEKGQPLAATTGESQRPQSPPGDYYLPPPARPALTCLHPKDLNPRQGITTDPPYFMGKRPFVNIPKTSIPARGLLRRCVGDAEQYTG